MMAQWPFDDAGDDDDDEEYSREVQAPLGDFLRLYLDILAA
jgi:hypothetical protein